MSNVCYYGDIYTGRTDDNRKALCTLGPLGKLNVKVTMFEDFNNVYGIYFKFY